MGGGKGGEGKEFRGEGGKELKYKEDWKGGSGGGCREEGGGKGGGGGVGGVQGVGGGGGGFEVVREEVVSDVGGLGKRGVVNVFMEDRRGGL